MGNRNGRRRSPSKGDVREEKILESAATLLRERPLHQVTVTEIATGAGITAPTFYFYFSTKADVLAALLERVLERIRTQLTDWLEDGDAEPAIRAVLETNACVWGEHGALLREIYFSTAPEPRIAELRDQFAEWLVAAVADRIATDREAGTALPGPPGATELARTLCGMVLASFATAASCGDPALRDGRLVRTLTTIIVRSVYGSG
ncbi:TetR family transcriptional regulator [Haloactinospora alba]|uniref:TetR family transcriptional regulator n=1 Tax=Haloactinospora alba TaxID=405555 RepID=A0A543NKU9_9ACTN|nr:TetR/AcrR family transcriptional regulator [Haloactinospora alba]TQN32495.1 TetR family transcriptional regulator [Haloactinospora alba]